MEGTNNNNIVVEETDNIVFELNNQEPPYKFKCLGLSSNTPGIYKPLPNDFPFAVGKEYELTGKFPLEGVADFFENSHTSHKLGDTEVELITFDNNCNTPLNSTDICRIGVRIHKPLQGGRRRKSKKSKKSKKTKKTKKSKKSKKTKKSRKH